MASTQCYWDGAQWTGHIAPTTPATPAAIRPAWLPNQGASDTVVGLGYAASLLLPFVGLVVGIVVMAKGGTNQKHGVFMLAISVVVMAIALGAYA